MKTRRILIVDDKEENLYFLQALLKGSGYETDEAHHGAEALEQARQNPPDLIIADILMPVMDGFVLCREWKNDERLKSVPFIFYTATYTDERDREFALSLGAERFIVKPAEPDVLMGIIQETLQHAAKPAAVQRSPDADAPLRPSVERPADESIYLKQYNQTLIRKLEAKMEQLEKANRELELDIASRKQTEEALRDSEGRFRSLVESAPEGIFVQSEGRFVFLNPAMVKLLGAARAEDLLGTDLMERIAPEYHEAVQQRIMEQRETGKPVPFMGQEYLRLDGSRVAVETTAVAIRFEGQDAHLVFVRDITERRQAEEEQEKLRNQLNQLQKMESIGRLAGGVAHDFNNMLGVILGYTQMAMEKMDPAQPLFNYLKEIRKVAERSADLTRQLLAFARKQTVAPRILDLNETVNGMLNMLQRLIGESIDLAWLPGRELRPVKVDPAQIDQILANLCVNAKDAISGVGRICIETSNVSFDDAYCAARADFLPGDYVQLTVSDNGSGMDRATLKQIFEPFFTTKSVGKGTGLGLSTVYGIVKQNHGFINVYSEPGQGTSFKIYLPQHKGESVQFQVKDTVSPVAEGIETVLLVEDEPALLELGQMMLKSLGYRVLAAGSPLEALELVRSGREDIHLLLTDVVMPEMNGKDLFSRLLALYPRLRCLYMSGYTADVIAHHGVLEEGVNFIQKPVSTKDLAVKVRAVLDGK